MSTRRTRVLRRLRSAALILGLSFLALIGLVVAAVEGASYFVELPRELARGIRHHTGGEIALDEAGFARGKALQEQLRSVGALWE